MGSVPLGSADEVFQVMVAELGRSAAPAARRRDRARAPTGSCGSTRCSARARSSRSAHPAPTPPAPCRACASRDGESAETIRFDELGYAQAALASYRAFARRKRDGLIPVDCRFQVSLPTPLAPIAAFVAPEDQARIEPLYEARMMQRADHDLRRDPARPAGHPVGHELRVRHARRRHAHLVHRPPVEHRRAPRAARAAACPPDVTLGYHFCHGHERHHRERPYDAQPLVDIANALSLSLGRSLDWIHLPVAGRPRRRARSSRRSASSRCAPRPRSTSACCTPSDGLAGARARIVAAQRFVHDFGVATDCGWGRHRPQDVAALIELHRGRHDADRAGAPRPAGTFAWPEGWDRIPDDDWTHEPIDAFGAAYDTVDHHSWYRNLDPTVEELSHLLADGEVLIDYSGGTGILVDRLKLRMFGTQAGAVIVDSSPKFLRVALEKFRTDPKVGLRLLRFLKDEKRLQRLDEVLGPELLERGVDVIASTNAIHLYPDLADTVGSWVRVLRPGGHVLDQLGQHPQPAGAPQRVDPRRDRVGGRARSPRAWCGPIPPTPPTCPTSTTPSACGPTPPTATACSSTPGRSTSTSRRSSWPG